jgi:hypothetical protein
MIVDVMLLIRHNQVAVTACNSMLKQSGLQNKHQGKVMALKGKKISAILPNI